MSALTTQTRSLFRAYLRVARCLVEPAVRRKAILNVREAFCAGHALDPDDPTQRVEVEALLAKGEEMLPAWQRVAAASPETQELFGRKPKR